MRFRDERSGNGSFAFETTPAGRGMFIGSEPGENRFQGETFRLVVASPEQAIARIAERVWIKRGHYVPETAYYLHPR